MFKEVEDMSAVIINVGLVALVPGCEMNPGHVIFPHELTTLLILGGINWKLVVETGGKGSAWLRSKTKASSIVVSWPTFETRLLKFIKDPSVITTDMTYAPQEASETVTFGNLEKYAPLDKSTTAVIVPPDAVYLPDAPNAEAPPFWKMRKPPEDVQPFPPFKSCKDCIPDVKDIVQFKKSELFKVVL